MHMSPKIGVLVGALVLIALTTLPQPARAVCKPLPDVAWWQSTHDEVIKFVDGRHKGDWDGYIAKWAKYGKRMKNLHRRGGSATIKSHKLKLQGASLKKYVRAIDNRVSVLNCLAVQEKLGVAEVANFPTAAGGGDLVALAQPRNGNELADYAVEIIARCDGDNALFQVINRGKDWPQEAAIGIYRTRNVGLVMKRVAQLTGRQTASLRVAPERGRATQEYALWVQPSWQLRDFQFDTRLTCN